MPNSPPKSTIIDRRARGGLGRPPRARAAIACAGMLILLAPNAHADICKYSDPDGNTHYSNLPPEKNWKKLSCSLGDNSPPQPVAPAVSSPSPPSRATATPTPPGFPRVDVSTQRNRDDMRRRVLAEELSAEQNLLADARAAYADGAPTPLPDERTDAEKYRARIGKLRQSLNVHEKNVEALKKELAGIK